MGKKRKMPQTFDIANDNTEIGQIKVSVQKCPEIQPNYNFEIRCAGKTWVVHRANLCAKSKFALRRIFQGKSGQVFNYHVPLITKLRRQEGLNRIAELCDEDPELVERMLLAISTPKYPAVPAKYYPENDLIEDARLYAMADKYDIPTLEIACTDAFKELLNNIGTRRSRMLFIRLGELLPLLYEMTPITNRVLRDTFEAFITKQQKLLLPRQDIHDFAMENGQFGIFIMKTNHKYWQRKGKQWCVHCESYQRFDNSKRQKPTVLPRGDT